MMLVPGTIIIGLILIWFMFRRVLAVLVAWLLTGAVVNASMILFIIFSVPYTMISGMLAPLLSALTTAFLIHFYSYLKLASSYQYEGKKRVSFAVEQIKKPAFYTALTTILGLTSMYVSPILPIGHFGLMSGFGVATLFVLLIWVIPAIFVRFDQNTWMSGQSSSVHYSGLIDRFIRFSVTVSIRHAGKIIALCGLLLAAGIPWIFMVTAETNMLKFFPETHPVTMNTHLIENELSGVMPLEIIFSAEKRDDFKRVDKLKQLENLQSWLIDQPEIDKVSSLVGFMKDMHKGINMNEAAYDVLPDNDILISQYLFIYDGDELYELVNREFNQTRMLLSLNIHNSNKIRSLESRINQYMNKNLDGLKTDISGDAKLFSDQDELLITGQLYSIIIATLLIFMVMFLLFRNFSEALLSMLLNLSPIIVIFIIMGILGIWLDMATAMIASVAIGIAVDDTVHLMYGYKKRLAKGNSLVYSLVQSHYKTGRAIIVTTFILCAQFLLVATSSFIPTAHFGLLTAIGLLMALLFDLFLMPAMVIAFYHKKETVTKR